MLSSEAELHSHTGIVPLARLLYATIESHKEGPLPPIITLVSRSGWATWTTVTILLTGEERLCAGHHAVGHSWVKSDTGTLWPLRLL
jgi:hypothetical protein